MIGCLKSFVESFNDLYSQLLYSIYIGFIFEIFFFCNIDIFRNRKLKEKFVDF